MEEVRGLRTFYLMRSTYAAAMGFLAIAYYVLVRMGVP